MQYFSYDAIARTPLEKEPFEYVIVPNCMSADALSKVGAEFPAVPGPGSHPRRFGLGNGALRKYGCSLVEMLREGPPRL